MSLEDVSGGCLWRMSLADVSRGCLHLDVSIWMSPFGCLHSDVSIGCFHWMSPNFSKKNEFTLCFCVLLLFERWSLDYQAATLSQKEIFFPAFTLNSFFFLLLLKCEEQNFTVFIRCLIWQLDTYSQRMCQEMWQGLQNFTRNLSLQTPSYHSKLKVTRLETASPRDT